jgi:hypothetical protein
MFIIIIITIINIIKYNIFAVVSCYAVDMTH